MFVCTVWCELFLCAVISYCHVRPKGSRMNNTYCWIPSFQQLCTVRFSKAPNVNDLHPSCPWLYHLIIAQYIRLTSHKLLCMTVKPVLRRKLLFSSNCLKGGGIVALMLGSQARTPRHDRYAFLATCTAVMKTKYTTLTFCCWQMHWDSSIPLLVVWRDNQ